LSTTLASATTHKIPAKKSPILDIRSYEAFGGQHIGGSHHIDFGGYIATFAGWVLPPDADILLVAESPGLVWVIMVLVLMAVEKKKL